MLRSQAQVQIDVHKAIDRSQERAIEGIGDAAALQPGVEFLLHNRQHHRRAQGADRLREQFEGAATVNPQAIAWRFPAQRRRAGRRQRRDGARLHDEELAIREAPFDILRRAVIRFDVACEGYQSGNLRGIEHRHRSARCIHRTLRRPRRSAHGHHSLIGDHLLLDRAAGLVGHNLVRCHQPADDGLAQTPRRVDDDLVARAGDGIGGE